MSQAKQGGGGYQQPIQQYQQPIGQQHYQQPTGQQHYQQPTGQQHYQQPTGQQQPYNQRPMGQQPAPYASAPPSYAAPTGGHGGGYDQPLVSHHEPMPAEARLVPTTKYRDVAFIVVFIAHVVAVAVLAAVYLDRLHDSDVKWSGKDARGALASAFESRYTQIGIGCLAIGSLFGVFWLQMMKMFPGPLVWITLLMGPAWTMVGMSVAFYYGAIALGIILLLILLLQCLYVFIVRKRVPFAKAMLRLISRLVQDHPGTVGVAIVALIPSILWMLLLVAMLYARYTVYDRERGDPGRDSDRSPYEDGENDGLTLIAVFSLYFTVNVCKYVVHVTCGGAFAAWYFSVPFGGRVSSALKRAMTTSFGTICCAALVLAVLQTIRWLVRSARHSTRHQLARCILDCILGCIENLMRLFNKFALSYTAIYGLSMMESSRRVWEMFKATGFSAIVNEDMIGGVVAFGALIGGVFTAACAALMAYLIGDNGYTVHWLPAALIGLFVGISMTFVALEPISAGSSTMYVCFTEDPRALFVADAAHAREISDAWQMRWNRPFVPGQ